MNSRISSAVEQGSLELVSKGPLVDVPASLVAARKSFTGAINLCIEAAGLDHKVVSIELAIDEGHLSNILKGKGHFPPDKLNALMDLCGNEAPLQWLANKRGYGLVLLKSEAERRAEAAEMLLAEERRINAVLKDLLARNK